MKKLPSPATYDREMIFLPWVSVIRKMIDYGRKSPKNFKILDLMCGTGYLLGNLSKDRPDLQLTGIDIESQFISYASNQYSAVKFIKDDVLLWKPTEKYDIIFCTGALHHLRYKDQPKLIEKISKSLSNIEMSSFFMADSFIRDYHNEMEKKLASLELGNYYITYAIEKNAPADIIEATIDILHNDILDFECKTSICRTEDLLRKYFSCVQQSALSNIPAQYGDRYFVCGNNF
ncbi:class I SAM-dependent methyltransferase [Patescibacteria group bacterium]